MIPVREDSEVVIKFTHLGTKPGALSYGIVGELCDWKILEASEGPQISIQPGKFS